MWVAYEHGAPAGYFELERQPAGNVEIVYFGLLPQRHRARHRGLDAHRGACAGAWAIGGTRRVWLHTCTLDGPYARANYEARGLRLFDTVVAMEDLPDDMPALFPDRCVGTLTAMARARTETVLVTRVDAGVARRTPDELVVEEPLEIRLDDHLVATTMRTPGHDFELAVGFCFTDGLLAGRPSDRALLRHRFGARDGVQRRHGGDGRPAPEPVPRVTTTTSSCGLCGSTTLDDLAARLEPVPPSPTIPLEVLAACPTPSPPPGRLRRHRRRHAAAAFAPTARSCSVREDIGRHNAVDKVVGRLLLDGGCPPPGSACSSAAGPASSWSRRRGRPGSPLSWPSARRPPSPWPPLAPPASSSPGSPAVAAQHLRPERVTS
jgi:FdhD protein